jgi:hypothetical protein
MMLTLFFYLFAENRKKYIVIKILTPQLINSNFIYIYYVQVANGSKDQNGIGIFKYL